MRELEGGRGERRGREGVGGREGREVACLVGEVEKGRGRGTMRAKGGGERERGRGEGRNPRAEHTPGKHRGRVLPDTPAPPNSQSRDPTRTKIFSQYLRRREVW
jgi:hypothetical protein